jgi:hypothetical protein
LKLKPLFCHAWKHKLAAILPKNQQLKDIEVSDLFEIESMSLPIVSTSHMLPLDILSATLTTADFEPTSKIDFSNCLFYFERPR